MSLRTSITKDLNRIAEIGWGFLFEKYAVHTKLNVYVLFCLREPGLSFYVLNYLGTVHSHHCWLSCPSVRFPFDYNIIKFTIYIFLVSSCFLSFFDLRIPITPLVSSNSSCPIICRHLVIDSNRTDGHDNQQHVKSREKTLTNGILFPVVGDKHTWWVKLMILVIAIFLDILGFRLPLWYLQTLLALSYVDICLLIQWIFVSPVGSGCPLYTSLENFLCELMYSLVFRASAPTWIFCRYFADVDIW
jgi:hypothetical protein